MKSEYLISIIVPVYNVEKYLEKSINSVLIDDGSVEIILIDDGSNDNSVEICDRYAAKYKFIKAIHQENSGPGKARNVGLELAKGKYILFLDSDDIINQQNLILTISQIRHVDYDILVGNKFDILYSDGRRLEKVNKINKKTDEGRDFLEYCMKRKKWIPITYIWVNLYKKEFIIKNNIFFKENIKLGEDTDWNIRCYLYANSIQLIQNKIYIYRGNRDDSLVNKKDITKFLNYFFMAENWINSNNSQVTDTIKCYFADGIVRMLFEYSYIYNDKSLIEGIEKSNMWKWTSKKMICKYKDKNGIKNFLKKISILEKNRMIFKVVKKIFTR